MSKSPRINTSLLISIKYFKSSMKVMSLALADWYTFNQYLSWQHLFWGHLYISGISQLLLTRFGLNFKGKVKARSRQGQGKVKARSRQGQGKVKARSRQGQCKVEQQIVFG